MMSGIWHHSLLSADELPVESILTQLSDAGIRTYPLNHGPSGCPGILFFTAITKNLIEFLRVMSRAGLTRVLAVAADSKMIEHRTVWDLLGAGASDVIAMTPRERLAEEVAARFERWKVIDNVVS